MAISCEIILVCTFQQQKNIIKNLRFHDENIPCLCKRFNFVYFSHFRTNIFLGKTLNLNFAFILLFFYKIIFIQIVNQNKTKH